MSRVSKIVPIAVFALLFVSAVLQAEQRCYRATSLNNTTYAASKEFALVSASCTSTPAGHGWVRVVQGYSGGSAPSYELWVAVPTSWGLTNCWIPQYVGEGAGVPVVVLQLLSCLCCGSSNIYSTTSPPACPPVSVSISGPSALPLHVSGTFTNSFTGSVPSPQFWWTMRFRSTLYGWGAWSSPWQGLQSTSASSNSCGFYQFEIKGEVRANGCASPLGSGSTIVAIYNSACPW